MGPYMDGSTTKVTGREGVGADIERWPPLNWVEDPCARAVGRSADRNAAARAWDRWPYTPVPTFTVAVNPDFDVSYTGLDTCVDWWPEIELTNTGTVGFRSVGITVRDTVTGVVVASLADEFINKNGCDSTTTRDRLVVGKTRIVSAPAFSYDPSGHKIHATITLCSETGQNGTCVTRTINFTP